MMGATSFHNEAQRGLAWLADNPDAMKNVTMVSVPDEERAKMDAVIAEGLKGIFAEYAGRGIENAEAIYNAMNQ